MNLNEITKIREELFRDMIYAKFKLKKIYENKEYDWIFATNLVLEKAKYYVKLYKKRWGIETIDKVISEMKLIMKAGGCGTNVSKELSINGVINNYHGTIGNCFYSDCFVNQLGEYALINQIIEKEIGRMGIVITFYETEDLNSRTNIYNHGISNNLILQNFNKESIIYFNLLSTYGKKEFELSLGENIVLDLQGIKKCNSSMLTQIINNKIVLGNVNEFSILREKIGLGMAEISKKSDLIVKDGKSPVSYFSKGKFVKTFSPYQINPIVHNIGAGDAFAAGLIAEYQFSGSIEKSIRNGLIFSHDYLKRINGI
jgi:sugar/nucleoside kinase (ribokinase family)